MALNLDFIRGLASFLDDNPCLDFDARVQILYPLLDQLYKPEELMRVELDSGLILDYFYKSNIAKEILLRSRLKPSHAWEPMTTAVVQLALDFRPGNVLIGGAYFGDHALVAANQLFKHEQPFKVVCVEPNSEQRNLLNANAILNSLQEKIVLEDAVLWSEEGLCFELDNTDSHASVRQSNSSTYLSKTIDTIVLKNKLESISLLMLDIEGSEECALKGASELLSMPEDHAPIVIFEVHRKYVDWSNGLSNTSIVENLVGHGYTIYALRDCQSNWELDLEKPELIPLTNVVLDGPPHGFNVVASKTDNFFNSSRFNFVNDVSPKYLRHRSPSLHMPISL